MKLNSAFWGFAAVNLHATESRKNPLLSNRPHWSLLPSPIFLPQIMLPLSILASFHHCGSVPLWTSMEEKKIRAKNEVSALHCNDFTLCLMLFFFWFAESWMCLFKQYFEKIELWGSDSINTCTWVKLKSQWWHTCDAHWEAQPEALIIRGFDDTC